MQTYCATFIPGVEEVVRERLARIHGLEIRNLSSGFVVFESQEPWKKFQNIRYLNNVLYILKSGVTHGDSVQAVTKILKEKLPLSSTLKEIVRGKKTFKLVVSVENQTIAADRSALMFTESQITRSLGLALSVRAPSIEFWLMVREDGHYYFGVRVSSPRKENKERADGELRSEVAHIMTLISNPKPDDVVYDPFCGYGAILHERGYVGAYAHLYGGDSEALLARAATKALKDLKNVTIVIEDSLKTFLPEGSISTIITDPPWGLHQGIDVDFYHKMFALFLRVLKPRGVAVVLTGAKDLAAAALKPLHGSLDIEKRYEVLISGKKATLYKLRKT